MNIGIICPSEIALRRFMPALKQCDAFSFAGLGVFNRKELFHSEGLSEEEFKVIHNKEVKKAKIFVEQFGGKIYEGYESVLTAPEIDAVYIPLPPALHFYWAKKALEAGKHVLVEKPATISARDTEELVSIAKRKKAAFHENYMFMFHNQLQELDRIIHSGEIGDIRLYRISFGFPRRDPNDFRYNKELGGGALIDAGGYTIQYATHLLGSSARLVYAQSNFIKDFEVDIYGSAAMINDSGTMVQMAFGMDNSYKCDLEVWGSKGTLSTGRVLTAPSGFVPKAKICLGNEERVIDLPADDAFRKSIEFFEQCILDETIRMNRYQSIVKQSLLVDEFKKHAAMKL